MSWLARSIANSLKLDDNDNDGDDGGPQYDRSERENNVERETNNQPDQIEKGVKEDLSELTKTLSRQFWGVASFLAPPPQSQPPPSPPAAGEDDREVSDAAAIGGIRSDFAEIGGKFKSGISKLSSNIGVSEFTKIASNLLQLGGSDEDEGYGSVGDAVGVTDEVVAFVRDIVMHPETWLDFPLPDDDEQVDNEFDMSDTQQEHALAVERLVPRLAALRIELCPGYMSEDCFWKIYFVLLHPRLNKHDAELLSTPQIVKARALLTHELKNQNKAKPEQDRSESGILNLKETSHSQHEEILSVLSNAQSESSPHEPSTIKPSASTVSSDLETEKHLILSKEIQIIDKSIIEEEPLTKKNGQILNSRLSGVLDDKYEDDADDWLKEESSEIDGDGGTTIPVENEEDVSFSDLEDEDEDVLTNKRK